MCGICHQLEQTNHCVWTACCDLHARRQLLIVFMELPGTLAVQFVVDSPRGPKGLLGGRRGVQARAATAAHAHPTRRDRTPSRTQPVRS